MHTWFNPPKMYKVSIYKDTSGQIYTKVNYRKHRRGTQEPRSRVPAKGGAVLGPVTWLIKLPGAWTFIDLVAGGGLLGGPFPLVVLGNRGDLVDMVGGRLLRVGLPTVPRSRDPLPPFVTWGFSGAGS